jgi:hypothetical protein
MSGSAKVTGGPPGLQIQCGGLTTSQVGSIPMHFRQFIVSAFHTKLEPITHFPHSIAVNIENMY